MTKRNFFSKMIMVAAIIFGYATAASAQTNVGAECGCPDVASRTSVDLATLAVSGGASDGDLLADHTILSCNNVYILSKKIFVPSGKTLTIKPGTVIKANTGPAQDATSLVVSRGGTIIAAGEESCPIILTAAADPLDGSYGVNTQSQWGGVVILGTATNNLLASNTLGVADGLGIIEGFATSDPRAYYGADLNGTLGNAETFDDNDNSGIFTYVSIRHGGATVGPDNELNGLTLGSVGRGTCIHHVEVVANSDDGVEFFGGTVDLKYAAVWHNDDDGFDWDHGWSGRGQFWLVVKGNGGGDNGLEIDGDDNNSGAAPLSNPTVYNVTCLGVDSIGDNSGDRGIEAKELTQGSIYNSIFSGYASGLNLVDAGDGRPTDAYDNWIAGSLVIENTTFIGNTTGLTVDGGAASGSDLTKFSGDGNVIAAAGSVSGFDQSFYIDGANNSVTDQFDVIPVPGLGTVTSTPVDGFFCSAPYRGAFAPGEPLWITNWSYASLVLSTKGVLDCPTDINGDGVTNNADFLELLGKFNQSCD